MFSVITSLLLHLTAAGSLRRDQRRFAAVVLFREALRGSLHERARALDQGAKV